MHFLADYGLFLVKTVTLLIAILILIAGIISLSSKGKAKDKQQGRLTIKKLNRKYDAFIELISTQTLSKAALKASKKSKKKQSKKNEKKDKPRLFVLNFHGDIKASATQPLSEEITAILLTAQKNDEVLIRLESPGGMVNAYGLAADQINRLKTAHIRVTIAVDKMAASGGYMMASVADYIIAAPFAIIGSVGVVFQLPNFNRLLKNKDIDFEQITAGQYKRNLTLLGENTDADRAKTQQEIDETHALFKQHILQHRQQLDIEKIATGEHWYGTQAIELQLIDALQTSDDFLLQAKDNFDMYTLAFVSKKPMLKRMSTAAHAFATRYLLRQNQTGGSDYLS